MNQEEIYQRWVQERSRVEIVPGFAGRVMSQIKTERSGTNRLARRWSHLVGRISLSSWAQAAAVGLAFLVGLSRVLASLYLLLSV